MIGCAVAYFLARQGASVLLLERDAVASHASGAAAGMLAPIGESQSEGPLLAWGLRSLALFPELCAELRERSGVDPEYVPSGVLRVAHGEREARRLRRSAEALPIAKLSWLEAEQARAVGPPLAPDLVGALWSPDEGHVRSSLMTRAYAGAARRLGARIETGSPVVGRLRAGERVVGARTAARACAADHVVLCMGAWAPGGRAWLETELALPVEPVRGQILSLDAPSPSFSPIVWGPGAYLVPKRDGSVVVGATEERVGFDCRVTVEGATALLSAAPRLVPALAGCTVRGFWAGLRPDTPDHLPIIGVLPGVEGLLLAVGHYRNGVLLSPVTGRLVADAIAGKGFPEEARLFAPDRFLGPR